MTRQEVIDLIVRTARQHDLVPAELLGGIIAESNLNPNAERPTDPGQWRRYWEPPDPFDVSFGLGQQTVRYADEYTGGDAYPGDAEIARIRDLYLDPVHACDVAAEKYRYWRYDPEVSALQAWCGYNGGSYFYRNWQASPNLANYQRGLAEAAAILGGAVPATAPVYDPNTPIVPQNDDWDCAEQSTLWALTAYGRHPADSWMENQMLSEHIESTAEGLLDASGASLAAWIVEQYGEFGYGAYNLPSVTFNDVMANAGLSPLLIGGRAWNHWSGVRRYNQNTGLLELANPANGWKDVQQTMDRAQFERLGPFSAVVVTWGDQLPPAPLPPLDDALSIATLQAQVDDLTKQRDELLSAVAYQADTVGDALMALVKELQRVRIEHVGPRPQ